MLHGASPDEAVCPPCLGEAMRRGSIVYITIFMDQE